MEARTQQLLAAITREINGGHGEEKYASELGNAHTTLNEVWQAIARYEQAIIVAREIGDRREEGIALSNLGLANVALGETDKAIDYFEKTLVIYREIGDRHGEAVALSDLGVVHLQNKQLKFAQSFFGEACIIFSQLMSSDVNDAALGLIQACGSIKAANSYLINLVNRTAQLSPEQKLKQKARVLQALSKIAIDQGAWSEAREMLENTIEYHKTMGEIEEIARDSRALAEIFYRSGNLHNCLLHYTDAINLFRRAGNQLEVAGTLEVVGKLEVQIGEWEDGMADLKQAMSLYEQIGDLAAVERLRTIFSNYSKEYIV